MEGEIYRLKLTRQTPYWQLGLIFLLISLVIAIYFSIKQTRQINLMSRCVDAVKAKNFNAKIPIVIAGELGDLAHTFNQMTTEIQDGYSRLEEYATTLEEQVKVKWTLRSRQHFSKIRYSQFR